MAFLPDERSRRRLSFGLYNADSIAYPDGSLEPDTLIATGITNKDGELTFCGSFLMVNTMRGSCPLRKAGSWIPPVIA